jgi:hypothetical protein
MGTPIKHTQMPRWQYWNWVEWKDYNREDSALIDGHYNNMDDVISDVFLYKGHLNRIHKEKDGSLCIKNTSLIGTIWIKKK